MFQVKKNKIYLTRGDKCEFDFKIEGYNFNSSDFIYFRVYNKDKLNEAPLINKKIEVKEETDTITVSLSKEETKIGEMQNVETEYWYEIELNGEQTVLGYDDKGAKILILYPEGADKNE